ncbi:uncharacterized protein LOC143902973 isoform X3 [Temnothorax americanus]|uniref:uncharacterized protein LOC143902973 isoform X3 n=1 Tax=Temnothorax americanus TaxID=1964332 RepID=UPI0040678B36
MCLLYRLLAVLHVIACLPAAARECLHLLACCTPSALHHDREDRTPRGRDKTIGQRYEEEIDKESFMNLSEREVSRIITTIGGIHCFLKNRNLWADSIKQKRCGISDDFEPEKSLSCQNEQLSKSLTVRAKSDLYLQEKNQESSLESKETKFSKLSGNNDALVSTSYFNKGLLSDEILNTTINNDVNSENESHNAANVLHSSDESINEKENTNSILRKLDVKKSKSTDKTDNPNKENKIVCVCPSHSATIQNTDLEKLLSNFIDGQIIIKFYEKHNILDEAKRKKLTDLLVTHFMYQKSGDTTKINKLDECRQIGLVQKKTKKD